MHQLLQDIRYGFRTLTKNLAFTVVVVMTLGVGIGANTAIFSVVDRVLLRPLPFPEPEQLVSVWADYTRRDGPLREWLSFPNFFDLRAETDVFQEVAIYGGWGPTITGQGEAELLAGAQITAGMFSKVLRVAPMLGRGFAADDDQPGAPIVILLSHAYWVRAFGEDTGVIGRTLSLSDVPHTVIGVMPPDFIPPFVPAADIWRPAQQNAATGGGRGNAIIRSFARLQPGMTLESARTHADALGQRLETAYPQANAGVGYALFDLHADTVRQSQRTLWVLLGAVGFVLMIACVNVANLVLARTTARSSELAVRSALGAGNGVIARQLFTESALLAALGGIAGTVLAVISTNLLVAMAPPGTPRIGEVAVDIRVLAFAALITAASTVIFGLLPAMRASRTDLHSALKDGGRADTGSRGGGLRNTLVVGQVSLALMLLVGAGLLVRSLRELAAVDLGFDPNNVLSLTLNLPPTRYPDGTATTRFYRDLEEQLSGVPGVMTVGSTSVLPLSGNDSDTRFNIEGQPAPQPGENLVWYRRVTPEYFETMRLPIVAGRSFTAGDDSEAPRVMIVNETLANRYFPDRNPIGQRLNVNNPQSPVWRDIVGVARDIKNFGIQEESRNAMYLPYSQAPAAFRTVVIRADGDAELLTPTVRTVIAGMDPALAPANVGTMNSLVDSTLGPQRFVTTLLTLFAAVALALAVIGLYGVVSYNVSRRAHEMGVRIALGAAGGDIGKLIVGKSLILVGVGVAIGLVGALAVTRAMASLLFGVSATDPLTFGATAVLLTGVATAASALPARRAARVSPVAVLRME